MRLETGVCVSCLLREGLETGDHVSKAVYETVLGELDARDKPWRLGNYEILEQIGCGGMGVIYRARQRHSQRIVAVKRLLSYRPGSQGALRRFRREAQTVASLDHPNILPIYEVSEGEDGLPFFSMKLAEKGSLSENVASLRCEPRTCVQLMAKVARAVEYAHSHGVLHRDIKPGNILLNDRGEPLVSDFGLAKLLDGNNDLTRSLTAFGTAGFIAPEQARNPAVDFTPAADVYSLGAVLFNMLTGRPPFLGSNPVSVICQASEAQAPKLRTIAPSLDRDLETICARCLERDSKARYQSAGDLAADLEHWLAGRPIVARPVSPPARIWRWSRRNPKLVGAAMSGVLLGGAVVWLCRGELFQASQFNPPDRGTAVLPFTAELIDARNGFRAPRETYDRELDGGFALQDEIAGSIVDALKVKPVVRLSVHEQPGNRLHDGDLQALFTDVPHPTAVGSIGISVPVQNPSNPFTVPDYTSPAGFELRHPDTRVTPASPGPEFTTSVRFPALEAGLRTNKITAKGPASIQGFVKYAEGEPIEGADVWIESRDGKQVFSRVKTGPNGRYVSQGLQSGVYRVTLLVNGAVKASIMNTQTKANEPTLLNFDLKPTSQAGNTARDGKHMVWVPAHTGSHLGGNWVVVDDKGKAHSSSKIQTVTTPSW
jgi:tRNA A-37 threonylcarbamoyl transferase component Bud32